MVVRLRIRTHHSQHARHRHGQRLILEQLDTKHLISLFFLTLLHRHRPFLADEHGRLTQPPSRSIPCPTVHETIKAQHIETREFHIPRILQYGIFVIGCPPAEPSDENSEHFTSSEDNSSLNTVPRRPDVSSPDHPSTSLSGRRLVEGTDFQQL